jgi:hypothetical protein
VDTSVPGKGCCFVSHSYEDEAALEKCLGRRFPRGWRPFVFPPMTVTPDQAVSDHLIDALTACDGLVYLGTPASLGSFWVGFERNMAARLGKPVYAFHPRRWVRRFVLDSVPPVDPLISVLFNLCVPEDIETVALVREMVWDRHRFEIRGDQWRRLDNDARQMFDSIEGMVRKMDRGGVALVFLSNASVCDTHHDYVDAFTYRRAIKDMETPVGYTSEKFARLVPSRTLVIWLESPDADRIESALGRMPQSWASYVEIVRASLRDPNRLVAFQPNGRPDYNKLDTMIARCFWAARNADPAAAAALHQSLARRT